MNLDRWGVEEDGFFFFPYSKGMVVAAVLGKGGGGYDGPVLGGRLHSRRSFGGVDMPL